MNNIRGDAYDVGFVLASDICHLPIFPDFGLSLGKSNNKEIGSDDSRNGSSR